MAPEEGAVAAWRVGTLLSSARWGDPVPQVALAAAEVSAAEALAADSEEAASAVAVPPAGGSLLIIYLSI